MYVTWVDRHSEGVQSGVSNSGRMYASRGLGHCATAARSVGWDGGSGLYATWYTFYDEALIEYPYDIVFCFSKLTPLFFLILPLVLRRLVCGRRGRPGVREGGAEAQGQRHAARSAQVQDRADRERVQTPGHHLRSRRSLGLLRRQDGAAVLGRGHCFPPVHVQVSDGVYRVSKNKVARWTRKKSMHILVKIVYLARNFENCIFARKRL